LRYKNLSDFSIGKGTYGISASAVGKDDNLPTYLRITDINDDGTINFASLKSVDRSDADKYRLQPNDIVFARTGGSTGRSYFYDGKDGEFVFAGFLIKFSIDPQKCIPKFIKYYCQSREYYNWVASFNTGSTRGNINAKTFEKMPIPDLPLEQQQLIVDILSPIDDKIENNKKINHHLVEQAYAIYKEVCVNQKDDSFVEETIKSISQKVITGKTPSTKNKDYYGGDLPFITIPDMHNNIYCVETLRYLTKKGEQTQPSKTLPKNSIIVSCIATPGLVSLLDRESQTNQQINAVIPLENQEYYLFLELLSKSKLIIELGSSGSTTYNLNKTQFEKIKISAPSIKKRYELNNLLRPLFLKINQTQHETIKLSQLRDTLLPKLLSGEISVNQATK